MFGGDAIIENLTVERPDLVAVDLFSGAQPAIRDLRVNGAGVDVIGSTSWRHGIGLSIGSGAAPLVERATFQNLTLRAVNVWGGSGGVLRGLTIANVTGATMAQANSASGSRTVRSCSRTSISPDARRASSFVTSRREA